MRLELAGLRSLVTLKNRELRTVKKLAQIVLSQRTEVEQFFLDALTQVKMEVAQRKSAAAEAAARAARNPTAAALNASGIQARMVSGSATPGTAGSRRSKLGTAGSGVGGASIQLTLRPDAAIRELGPLTLPAIAGATAAAAGGQPGGPAARPGSTGMHATSRVSTAASSAATALTHAEQAQAPLRRYAPGQKVDLAELLPEDKERVLRLLFAKINNLDLRSVRPAQKQEASPAAEPSAAEASLLMGAPFGLAADIPPQVQSVEYSARQPQQQEPSQRSARDSTSTGAGNANQLQSRGRAGSADGVPQHDGLEERLVHVPPREPLHDENVYGDDDTDEEADAEADMIDAAALATALAEKARERVELSESLRGGPL